MSEAIIVALITSGVSLLGIVFTTRRSNAELYAKLDKQSNLADAKIEAKLDRSQAVTDAKIDELTREVREHNNFARRVPVLEEQMKSVEHRVGNLEAADTRITNQIIDGYSHR